MLVVPTVNSWGWSFHNGGANPSATPGVTALTPGVAGWGSYATSNILATSANLTAGVWGLWVGISGGNSTGVDKSHLIEIGVDEAGGTNFAAIIRNIVCGQSQAGSTGCTQYYFPINIPAGASVSARACGVAATAGTVRVFARFFGKPSCSELVPRGEVSETIGSVSSTTAQGVSFTPGNAADGTWASLGTTTRNLWWWQLCPQVSAGTITAQYTWCDLAYGDATNKTMIIRGQPHGYYGTAEIAAQMCAHHLLQGYCYVPAGSTLYVRGRCNTAPVSGYNAVAIGIG